MKMILKSMHRHLALFAATLWIEAAGAQTQPPLATPLAFEVASIKPCSPDRNGGPPFRMSLGTFSMQGHLVDLIEQAYDIKPYQIAGGPPWMRSDWYDVLAKAGIAAGSHQLRLMMQALLADRFHLKWHRETRPTPGYVLIIDKNGPKPPLPRTDVPPDSKGVIQMRHGIWGRGVPMSQLAYGLTLAMGQPVVDETKIEGHYDVRLRFEDGDNAGATGSIFPALHEVGLKLEARKVAIEAFVVDSADWPSAN
jgi:uncharacterized protein (TIGR03435 family)